MSAKLLAMERVIELLCIAIDGSDQSSYSVPYFKQVFRSTPKYPWYSNPTKRSWK